MKFIYCFRYLWAIFALLVPNLDCESGYGSRDPIESGSDSDTDTDPQYCPLGYLNPDLIQSTCTRYSINSWIKIKVLLNTTSSSHLLAEKVAELWEAALAGQSLHRIHKLVQRHLRRFLFTRIGRMHTSEKIFLKMKHEHFLAYSSFQNH